MQVEAIYNQGRLELPGHLHLLHDRLRVIVTIPDEEIKKQTHYKLSPETIQKARAMREKLDAIRNAPLPPDEQLPELTAKQLERIAAFELREDR